MPYVCVPCKTMTSCSYEKQSVQMTTKELRERTWQSWTISKDRTSLMWLTFHKYDTNGATRNVCSACRVETPATRQNICRCTALNIRSPIIVFLKCHEPFLLLQHIFRLLTQPAIQMCLSESGGTISDIKWHVVLTPGQGWTTTAYLLCLVSWDS